MTRKKPDEEPKELPVHPLLKTATALQKHLERHAAGDQKEEVIIERIEEWKDCLNRLVKIPDAQHFFRHLIKHAEIFKTPDTRNTVKMVENAGKKAFYLDYVRPYLTDELRKAIE